jgi:hypothetical protein
LPDRVRRDRLLDSGGLLSLRPCSAPILINRPIVVTPWGVKLCRPSEALLEILPLPQRGPFVKEDGELVIDSSGKRITSPGSSSR